jgi:hypothetical protein
MIIADIVQGLFSITLIMALIRWAQGKINPQSDTGKALAYLFH